MVGDVDHGPDPPANAQPLAGRDDAAQRPEVRALVARAPRSPIHVGHVPGADGQVDGPQVRQCRLRLPEVRLAP